MLDLFAGLEREVEQVRELPFQVGEGRAAQHVLLAASMDEAVGAPVKKEDLDA